MRFFYRAPDHHPQSFIPEEERYWLSPRQGIPNDARTGHGIPNNGEAFCDDATLRPSPGFASIDVAYSVGSFASESREPRASWTHLASTPWPATLP